MRLQRGVLERYYHPLVMRDGSGLDWGRIVGSEHNSAPWHATWRVIGDWIEVPNVSSVDRQQTFDNHGLQTSTVIVENVFYKALTGAGGEYHRILRGYLAPWFGYVAFWRAWEGVETNEWLDVFNGGYRILIEEGYGDDLVPVFTGLIDDVDSSASPDTITLTCRDFGQALTDARIFGHNKAREIRSPVTFASSDSIYDVEKISAGARASTSLPGHPAASVMRNDSTHWESTSHSTESNTEYIEIRLPKGRYEKFYLDTEYPGMETFLSIYLHSGGLGGPNKCKVDGQTVSDGWMGSGSVPGAHGGHPYIRKWDGSEQGLKRKITHVVECGDNTILRISFRRLALMPTGDFRAGVRRLVAYKTKLRRDVKNKHWILVDDASDLVKWALMWAGFKEWEVESLGANIKAPMVFHQAEFLIDIIARILEMAGYVFFIGPPSDEDSLGVPIFRRTRATQTPGQLVEIRDKDLLTGIQTKFSKATLPFIIRARGREASKEDGGVQLGEDTSRRLMGVYYPPWSGAHHDVVTGEYDHGEGYVGRTGGIIRHVVHTDPGLSTEDECLLACILIAVQYVLESFTGTLETPGFPGFGLDEQVSVIDQGTGINSRMWIASTSSTITVGTEGAYTSSVGGSMLDTPDTNAVLGDFLQLAEKVIHGE